MSLQAGGAPAILQRDLGTPAAIQGAQAFGSAIYGPQLAAPLSGAVLMLAQDGAANFPLTAGGPTYTLLADGATYSYSGNDANLLYNRVLLAGGASYIYSGNDATLVYSGGPSPVVEIIGVGGPQVTNIFLFSGVTEPPFAVQRRTS